MKDSEDYLRGFVIPFIQQKKNMVRQNNLQLARRMLRLTPII